MNFVLILIFVVACTSGTDKNCTCKIVTTKLRTYCGYELRDPNCYPHAEYKCPNGDNGKAYLMGICHSTICNFEMDAASCLNYDAFEEGIKKVFENI
jgi:hypothetical protein